MGGDVVAVVDGVSLLQPLRRMPVERINRSARK